MHVSGQPDSGAALHRVSLGHVDLRQDLSALLNALQLELGELHNRRGDINRRIRLLDRTLRGLRAGVGQRACAPPTVASSAPAEPDRNLSSEVTSGCVPSQNSADERWEARSRQERDTRQG
jgi:hypothetical protein